MAVLMKYGFEELVTGFRRRLTLRLGARAVPSRVKRASAGRSRPERVRLALEELGPTFIKLGQLLSTRPDLIGEEYIAELERLQDQVAPEKFGKIRQELEAQLGGKIEDLFRSFDPQPVAAGSIAQVHRAVTKAGDTVAVKIRRPGIVETIRIECEMLEDLAGLFKATQPRTDNIDPVQLVREFTEAVTKEVDLANERHTLRRFARNFRDDPTVHVPTVYEDYCSDGVLTMEYIDGLKANDLKALRSVGAEPKVIAANGARFILRQIFEFRFFHTDPHPGNLLVVGGAVLVPLDFGQVARLGAADRRLLGDLVLAVVDTEPDRLIRAIEREGMVDVHTDVRQLGRDVEELLDNYSHLPLREIPFHRVMTQMFDLIRAHHIRPPAEFTLMLKSMMTIESLATTLDEDFQIIEHLKPYAARLRLGQVDPRQALRSSRRVLRDAIDLMARLPEELGAILGKFKRGQIHMHVEHEHLDNLVHSLDRSASRISFAMIIAALLIASSLLVSQDRMVLGLMSLETLGVLGYLVAAVMGFWLLISIIRSRHL